MAESLGSGLLTVATRINLLASCGTVRFVPIVQQLMVVTGPPYLGFTALWALPNARVRTGCGEDKSMTLLTKRQLQPFLVAWGACLSTLPDVINAPKTGEHLQKWYLVHRTVIDRNSLWLSKLRVMCHSAMTQLVTKSVMICNDTASTSHELSD